MSQDSDQLAQVARRHTLIGWWLLVVFVTLGIFLESLHGFKVDWYVNVSVETRRLTWRLAHAHGTFLAVIHLLLAHTLTTLTSPPRGLSWISRGLTAASILIPLGFFLGGVRIYSGDPGPGIALLPLGALVLLTSLLALAWSLTFPDRTRKSRR